MLHCERLESCCVVSAATRTEHHSSELDLYLSHYGYSATTRLLTVPLRTVPSSIYRYHGTASLALYPAR